ncbi:transglutaminase-like domain-containing protein [Agromyces salentinus]|uniref:Transglutaminase-like domain-containing protein n=1 Tax=Agromyces salentinus TaxID=269421 RepID=A0ABN2MVC3_9MICO|nr:transglutaminase-like domain-containing protein [Agromyces salentinus]
MSGPRRRADRPARASDAGAFRAALGLGYVVVAGLLATVAAWPIYGSARAILVAAVGILAGLGIVALARALPFRGPLRWLAIVGATVVAYLLLVVPVAIPSAMAGGPQAWGRGIRDGAVGIVVGWKQVLTLSLPLGEYQAVLVPFLLVMLVGTVVAGLLVVPDRRTSPLAVLVGFAMSGFGLAFGSSAVSAPVLLGSISVPAPRELLVAVGGLVAALAWLLLRARTTRSMALRRATAGTVQRAGLSGWPAFRRRSLAGLLVAVALVAGAVVAPAAAGIVDRSALRDAVQPEVVLRQTPTPLASYRSAFTAERIDEPWLSIEGDTAGIERLRLATLDAYDGETFHVGIDEDEEAVRFNRLPRAAVRAPGDAAFELRVGDGYSGIWVPAPLGLRAAPDFTGARAAALDDGFHRSADDATSIDTAEITDASGAGGGAPRGLASGDEYAVIAAPDGTRELGEPGGTALLDPEEYPALTGWLDLQGQSATAAGFLELVDRLRTRGYLSHATADGPDAAGWIAGLGSGYAFLPSYSGHSKARIEALFTQLADQQRLAGPEASDAALVAGIGDDEQFAVAVALIARALGYESRVVLGFRLPGAPEVPGVDACTDVCTGAALTAWTEVSGGADAWVPVDATPQHEVAPSLIQEGEQLPEHPTTPERPDAPVVEPPSAQSESNDAAAAPDDSAAAVPPAVAAWLRWTGLGAAAVLLALLPLAVLLLAKSLRSRRRRRDPSPEVRVVGAWEELVDLYADHGLLEAEHVVRADTARAVGRPAAATLAALVDRAVFAGDPPTSSEADAAWSLVDRERDELRGGARARRRLSARLSFASLARSLRPARASLQEPAR